MPLNSEANNLMQLGTPPEDAEAFHNQTPQSTGVQSIKAAFDLSDESTIGGAVSRMWAMHDTKAFAEANDAPKLTVEDLNKKFPNLPQPFTEPTDIYVASEINRRQTINQQLEQKVTNGPESGLYSAGRFGAGLLAHAIDPFELGTAALTGGASEAALGATAIGKQIGFGVLKKSLLQTAATGVIEGTAANLATEPFQFAASKQDLTPYHGSDAIKNAVLGGLAFGALKVGGSLASKVFNPKQVEAIHNVTVGRYANDKVPDVTPLVKDFATERSGAVNPEYTPINQYEFKKLDAQSLKEQKFFVPKESVEATIHDGQMVPVGEDFGLGVYATDNPAVANGISGSKTLESPGSVHEVNLGESNLKSFDKLPTPEEVHQAKLDGFDGIHYPVTETAGLKHEPYNAAMLFDGEKVNEVSSSPANTDAVSTPKGSEATDLAKDTLSHGSDLHYDGEAVKSFDEHLNQPVAENGKTEYDQHFQDLHQSLNDQLAQHPDTPGLAQGLEQIKSINEKAGVYEKLLKAATNCLLGGE